MRIPQRSPPHAEFGTRDAQFVAFYRVVDDLRLATVPVTGRGELATAIAPETVVVADYRRPLSAARADIWREFITAPRVQKGHDSAAYQ